MTVMRTPQIHPSRRNFASRPLARSCLIVGLSSLSACDSFLTDDYLTVQTPLQRLREIESIQLEDRSASEPVSVEDAAADMLLAFYESAISQSGIQLSAPPGKNGAMASQWETNLPSEIYYHPVGSPPPGTAGKLPMPAEEITWDGSQWRVTSDRIATGGAMHLANELNWMGPLDSVPFPKVITTGSTASRR